MGDCVRDMLYCVMVSVTESTWKYLEKETACDSKSVFLIYAYILFIIFIICIVLSILYNVLWGNLPLSKARVKGQRVSP